MPNTRQILIGHAHAARNWCYEHNLNPRDVLVVHSVRQLRQLMGMEGPIEPVWLHDASDLLEIAEIVREIGIINARSQRF